MLKLSNKYSGLQFFAPSAVLNIYSNDGTTKLGSSSTDSGYIVKSTGISPLNTTGNTWAYEGSDTFLGVSTTVNATTPEYAVGDYISEAVTKVYIVTKSGGEKI